MAPVVCDWLWLVTDPVHRGEVIHMQQEFLCPLSLSRDGPVSPPGDVLASMCHLSLEKSGMVERGDLCIG